MFSDQYHHGVLRKYVVIFGNLFNDIKVQRFNTAGQRVQTLDVPLAYGPKEKFLVRISQDPNLDQEVAISLPRMGFEMTGMTYAPQRKLPSTIKNFAVTNTTDDNKLNTQYTPAPYDIGFRLSIFVQNADDGVQIIEQILPYFSPEWTVTANLIPSMGIKADIPTILNSVTTEDTYEGDFATRRALIWTLDFTMKGYVYGPVRTTGVIKRSSINVHTTTNSGVALTDSVTTTDVTTLPYLLDSSGNAVPLADITVLDQYSSNTTITYYDDGVVR